MDQEQDNAGAFEPPALSDIFSREPSKPEREEPAGQPEPQREAEATAEQGDKPAALPAGEQPRTPDGKFAAKGEQKPAAGPPTAQNEPSHVPTAALKDERNKRQALERQIADLNVRIEQLSRQPSAQPPVAPQATKPPPQFWDDPEGFIVNIHNDIREEVRRELKQEALDNRLALSENNAKARYADYQQMEDVFAQLVQHEPALRDKLSKHPDPAEFAYRTAKHFEQIKRLREDPASALDDDAFAKVAAARGYTKAEIAAAAAPPAPPTPLPGSLADARSSGSRSAQTWTGPDPLESIFAPRKRR